MEWSCPLSDTHREQYESAIRDCIALSSENETSARTACRYVPAVAAPGEQDVSFALDALPNLNQIEVLGVADERTLGLTVYFDAPPESEETVVADDVEMEAGGVQEGDDLSALADLGEPYESLSTSLVSVLAEYTDAPTDEAIRKRDGDPWLGSPSPVCTLAAPELVSFVSFVHYPVYVEEVYAEGKPGVAKRLGIPY